MSTTLLEQPIRGYLHKQLTYCADCGRLSYETEDLCECCGGESLEQVSHAGAIYSYTTVHQSAGSFVLALIQLSGGRLITARIVGIDRELRIGLPVKYLPDAEPYAAPGAGGLFFSPLGTSFAMHQ